MRVNEAEDRGVGVRVGSGGSGRKGEGKVERRRVGENKRKKCNGMGGGGRNEGRRKGKRREGKKKREGEEGKEGEVWTTQELHAWRGGGGATDTYLARRHTGCQVLRGANTLMFSGCPTRRFHSRI